jgi:RecA-family ATPase
LCALVEGRGYGLVVIDNLTEIRAGASQNSENDATAMSAALRPLADLAHDHRCGVLVLHHAGASGGLRRTPWTM